MQTLVLDVGYQPINMVPFSRALTYLVKGKVELLESYEQPIHPDWQAPAVVRLTHWVQPYVKYVRFNRQNILARDRWRCQYCGQRFSTRDLTFDHLYPKSRGGKTTWENIVACCRPCNTEKGNRTPKEANMQPLHRPVRPSWLPVFSFGLQRCLNIPPEWREYWNVEIDA